MLHSAKERKGIECELCNKTLLTDERGLKLHVQRVHSEGNLAIKCSDCDKVFKSTENQKKHFRRVT